MKEVWIKPEVREAFEQKLKECHAICQKHTTRVIPLPKLVFVRIGADAGRCGKNLVIINPDYLEDYYDEQLNETLPHEFAHYVSVFLYGMTIKKFYRKVGGKYVKKLKQEYHSDDWRLVMEWLGKPAADRCHSFDISKAIKRKVSKPFRYTCGCSGSFHDVTAYVHRKHQTSVKGGYKCKRCKRPISFIGTVVNGKFQPKGTPNTPTVSLPVVMKEVSSVKRVMPLATYKTVTVFRNGILVNDRVPI